MPNSPFTIRIFTKPVTIPGTAEIGEEKVELVTYTDNVAGYSAALEEFREEILERLSGDDTLLLNCAETRQSDCRLRELGEIALLTDFPVIGVFDRQVGQFVVIYSEAAGDQQEGDILPNPLKDPGWTEVTPVGP